MYDEFVFVKSQLLLFKKKVIYYQKLRKITKK